MDARTVVVAGVIWLAAGAAPPAETPPAPEPGGRAEDAQPEAPAGRGGGARGREPAADRFVPSERIGAETIVPFPADI